MRVVLLAAVLALLASGCGDAGEPPPGTVPAGPAQTTAPTPTSTRPSTTTSLAPQATTPAELTGTPPWAGPTLGAADVPAVLSEQWERAENRMSCSALYPTALAPLTDPTVVRAADFGGGWALSWDLASGPGRLATGEYCEGCGRSAFGIAGAGVQARGDEPDRWPHQLAWDEGSKAGYGYEGDAATESGAPHLMYLLVKGEGCVYNVWSFLGEEHLLGMVAGLRFVAGLRGEPTAWASDLPAAGVRSMGAPPWLLAPLPGAELDRVFVQEWEGEAGAPAGCPLLVVADLGEASQGAKVRRAANEGEMLVAWDRPDGPGHDRASEPCADCGRGVVGLGTWQHGAAPTESATHVWHDGSTALMRAGGYGTEAYVMVDGFDCTYWLWSHLGPGHLEYLLTQLRRVEGYP